MTDVDPLIAQAIAAQEKSQRYGRLELLLGVLLVFVVAAGVLVFAVFVPRQAHVESQGDRAICIALLQADFDSAITAAFAAPPAPSTAREAAVARLNVTADRLHHVRSICAG